MAADDTDAPEQRFLTHLPVIERIISALIRRNCLFDDDAADFQSWVMVKLIDNDYSVIRKFRGESSFHGFLAVVVAMLLREWRVQRWGRWRPSAAARRRGPVAVQLETLVHRDGHRAGQAAEVLRSQGVDLSDAEVATLLAELPAREPTRPIEVGEAPLGGLPAAERADDAILGQEAEALRNASESALRRALADLSDEEQVVIRLRFWENLNVAGIARALGVEQRPLYRTLQRALARLRAHLERAGVSPETIAELLQERRN
jgi:RNA polymerase sigma factor (sigma-70 family)